MKTKVRPSPKSTLTGLLESGKKVQGAIGWVKLADGDSYDDDDEVVMKLPVYAKVKAIGLVDNKCGLKVRATLVGGEGEVQVGPNQWIDSMPKVKAIIDIARRQNLAVSDFKAITNSHFKTAVNDRLQKEINSLDKAKRELIIENFADYFRKEQPGILLSQSLDNLKELARKVVCVKHDLTPEQEPDSYAFRR